MGLQIQQVKDMVRPAEALGVAIKKHGQQHLFCEILSSSLRKNLERSLGIILPSMEQFEIVVMDFWSLLGRSTLGISALSSLGLSNAPFVNFGQVLGRSIMLDVR